MRLFIHYCPNESQQNICTKFSLEVYLHVKTRHKSYDSPQVTCARNLRSCAEKHSEQNRSERQARWYTFLHCLAFKFFVEARKHWRTRRIRKNETNPSPVVECRHYCWNFYGFYLLIPQCHRLPHWKYRRPLSSIYREPVEFDLNKWTSCPSGLAQSAPKVWYRTVQLPMWVYRGLQLCMLLLEQLELDLLIN